MWTHHVEFVAKLGAVIELVRLQRGERDRLSSLDVPALNLLRESFSHVRVDARVHQDVLEVVLRYGPAVRSLLRDELPGAAALRLVDPSGEHAARKLVAGHPSHKATAGRAPLCSFSCCAGTRQYAHLNLKLFARD